VKTLALVLLASTLAFTQVACTPGGSPGAGSVAAMAGTVSPAHVELDVFSGLPNPTWELSAADTATLMDMIEALPSTSPVDLPNPLGYRGFLVSLTAPESGSTGTIRAFQGVVEYLAGEMRYYADPGRQTERWLLTTARTHIEEELYSSVLAEIGGNE